ncbi:WbqC family protein [Aurantibacter sp.]|uniref:WbqC family protein n=1 Tax=Aurantibacter sp. TaxID=2807103 RepID=UPI0035C7FE97
MNALITPTLFPNLSTFVVIAQHKHVVLEVCDNYQKQTFRNRANIYGANGLLQLNCPVIYSQKERKLYKDVPVFNPEKWQLHIWKSLESAYKTSPFFEYYEDDLKDLFETEFKTVLDFNLKCLEVICDLLQIETTFSKTETFEKHPVNSLDFRHLAERKSEGFKLASYTQVFGIKHGFISNLSILDLLFNEGTNTLTYLESQPLA